jgi:hypothetical protein
LTKEEFAAKKADGEEVLSGRCMAASDGKTHYSRKRSDKKPPKA